MVWLLLALVFSGFCFYTPLPDFPVVVRLFSSGYAGLLMSSTQHNSTIPKPDYDLHLPPLFRYPTPFLAGSTALSAILLLLVKLHALVSYFAAGVVFLTGVLYWLFAKLLLRVTNLQRRLKSREKLLDLIPWRGDETVLDVGCGNGILLLGAAKRIPNGKGTGIDIWIEGAGDNSPDKFVENARIEGVSERVSLENEDVRKLPYVDNSFDVVMNGLTMHHILHGKDSEKAYEEMIRVLKPGGFLAVYDIPVGVLSSTAQFRKHGLDIHTKTSEMVVGVKAK